MKDIRHGVVVGVAVLSVLSAHTFVAAQAPVPGVAKHVRTVPIQNGRRVLGTPILNEVGSFSPLPPSRGIAVLGIVQNHLGILVPNAGMVIVRNLVSGRVVAQTVVNDLAQFSARGLPAGIYTAELIGGKGSVIASTPAFTAAAGEVIQIAQTIPAFPVPGIGRVIGSATTTAMSTAASSGVLAVAPGAPASPAR